MLFRASALWRWLPANISQVWHERREKNKTCWWETGREKSQREEEYLSPRLLSCLLLWLNVSSNVALQTVSTSALRGNVNVWWWSCDRSRSVGLDDEISRSEKIHQVFRVDAASEVSCLSLCGVQLFLFSVNGWKNFLCNSSEQVTVVSVAVIHLIDSWIRLMLLLSVWTSTDSASFSLNYHCLTCVFLALLYLNFDLLFYICSSWSDSSQTAT